MLISLEDRIGLPKPLKYLKVKTFSQDRMLIYSCNYINKILQKM